MNTVVRFASSSVAAPTGRQLGCCGLVLLVAVLAGCTAGWQAPLESRDASPRQAAAIPSAATAYRVRRGDTLMSIAWRANLDWRQLARWNRLVAPYTIMPGQMLRLRPLPVKSVVSARKSSPSKIKAKSPATRRQAQARPPPTQQALAAPEQPAVPPPKRKLSWRWPTDGSVANGYAAADPARKGIKIAGKLGQPVVAAESGNVVYSGSGLIGYGQLIIIKHNDNYLSAYGNNRKLLVKEDDQVAKGEKIAEMGRDNGGRSLLHFEIRREGEPVNPLSLLPRRRR